jgi:hypothetical protein
MSDPPSASVHSSNYAPTVIADHPDGQPYMRASYKAAMERLLNAGKIHVEEEGPPSRRTSFLALGPAPKAATDD